MDGVGFANLAQAMRQSLLAAARHGILCLAAVSPSIDAQNAEVQFPIERPVYRAGDEWTMEVIDGWKNITDRQYRFRFKQHQSNYLLFETLGANRFLWSTSLDGGRCIYMVDTREELCAGSYKFPLTTGARYQFPEAASCNGHCYEQRECEVKGLEHVAVKAGVFAAVRIDCEGFWRLASASWNVHGRFRRVVWYSPEAKWPVKTEFVRFRREDAGRLAGAPEEKWNEELVEYKPAP